MTTLNFPDPLPEPASLTVQQRLEYIDAAKSQMNAIQAGTADRSTLPMNVARWIVDLLQQNRAAAMSARTSTRRTAVAKPVVQATVDDL